MDNEDDYQDQEDEQAQQPAPETTGGQSLSQQQGGFNGNARW